MVMDGGARLCPLWCWILEMWTDANRVTDGFI
jgi:hypothetical protein